MSKEEEMERIEREIKNCKKCELWKTRNNPVIGEGTLNANIVFVGEAPGYNEDKQGKPFVGRAGKVFDELLAHIGLKREEIFITNVLKCRPPQNRNPLKNEISACTPYLDRQISIIRPRAIATLGSFALQYIFEKFGLKRETIGAVHGKSFDVFNLTGVRKIIPMYHPATATYNPETKNLLLKDFEVLKNICRRDA